MNLNGNANELKEEPPVSRAVQVVYVPEHAQMVGARPGYLYGPLCSDERYNKPLMKNGQPYGKVWKWKYESGS